jgi:HAD superfamily hydrolase (TIGR01490 family)
MSLGANQGGRIAAVFDIDRTLLPAPSLELRLLAHLALNREMRLGAVGAWLWSIASRIPKRWFASDENKIYLRGVRVDAAEEWIARKIANLEFFSEALTMIGWHRRRGHAIVLISGTLAPLARAVGSLLADGAEIYICATELEVDDGLWSGRVTGEAICGPAKKRALARLAAEHRFDLSRSYAYADSLKDRWLLGAVGHPIVVNSAPRLAQLARRCGWRLANWNERAYAPAVRKCDPFAGAENSAQVLTRNFLWK